MFLYGITRPQLIDNDKCTLGWHHFRVSVGTAYWSAVVWVSNKKVNVCRWKTLGVVVVVVVVVLVVVMVVVVVVVEVVVVAVVVVVIAVAVALVVIVIVVVPWFPANCFKQYNATYIVTPIYSVWDVMVFIQSRYTVCVKNDI